EAIRLGEQVADAVCWARDLVNEAPVDCTPERLARAAREVAKAWRSRTDRGPVARATGPQAADSSSAWYEALRLSPDRLLLAFDAGPDGPRDRLVVAGVVRDETAATLAPDVRLHRLTPTDAIVAFERADPDLLLVETGAFGAGRPWAYAGEAAGLERDRRLLELLAIAHRMGRPAVLWWTAAAPIPIGIRNLEPRFDLVVAEEPVDGAPAWAVGVQFARFHDLGAPAVREAAPLYVGAWDLRQDPRGRAAVERLLTAAAAHGLAIRVDARAVDGPGAFPARLRPCLDASIRLEDAGPAYRHHALVLGDGRAGGGGRVRALEAAACGASVLVLGDRLDDDPEEALIVAGATAPEAALAAALALPARDASSQRRLARRLFVERATPVALAGLVARAGLRVDALAGRRVTATVVGGRDLDEGRLVEDILGQVQRPDHLIVGTPTGDALGSPARAALDAAGVEVAAVRLTEADGASSPNDWQALARATRTAWLAPWSTGAPHPAHHLLDLLLAAESTRTATAIVTSGSAGGGPVSRGRSLVRPAVLADDLPPTFVAAAALEA
ncbi:MAG TPA: hypothetical protein VMH24_04165, partial [Candidatus Sulfotelmatobacter sp.]|nr:hypothetical protein [Candidatus Sulfotelmatobacter sp.]